MENVADCTWAPDTTTELNPSEEFPHYIEFRNVFKTFDRPVLKDVSFYVDSGQTLAIIGRSGVGKSVSLGHIMGFLKADSGQVIVANTDITRMNEEELSHIRRKVTMVFQSGALFDSLTVGENVEFSLETREDYDEACKESVTDDLLKKVDLTDVQNSYPSDLATGYKRAVAIARALAAQPQCILYDEPTTMVDPIMSDHIGNLMLRLKKDLKLTAVVVTHDLDLMRKVADTVMFLYKGEAIYFGPVDQLENCDHPHVKQFLAMDRVEIVGKIEEE
jgi:phospholipid/cholesterol/gamma-HCH transport system ATP-binding protein